MKERRMSVVARSAAYLIATLSLVVTSLAVVITPKSSEAKRPNVSLRIEDSLLTESRDDNQNGDPRDDNYQLAINRLNVIGDIYGVTLISRLDTMYFHSPPTDDFKTTWASLERLQLKKRWRPAKRTRLTLQLGDFYHRLGEGIILSLARLNELQFDVALRGAKASLRRGKLETTAFGGVTNVVNVDMVSMHHIEDRDDIIVGGETKYRLRRGAIGAMYAYMQPQDQEIDRLKLSDATSSGGLYFTSRHLDALNVYLELDAQQRRLAEGVQDGTAVYSRFNFLFDRTTILSEWLWLNDFQQRGSQNTSLGSRFNYNLGPNLERIDQEVVELFDVMGTRLRLEQELLERKLTLHVNALYRLNKPDDPMETTQYHGFGGFDWKFGGASPEGGAGDASSSKVALSGGHRVDIQGGYINRVWSHAEGGVEHSWSGFTVSVKTLMQRIQVEQQPFFTRGSTNFGLDKSGLGSVGFEWGIDTQNPKAGVRQHFYAGTVKWVVADFLTLQGLVGSRRGGIRCIAGVCRDFPELSGYQLQLVFNHNLNF